MQKKNLLITTALATLISTSAFADGASPSILGDMSVKIKGIYDPKVIFRNQNKPKATMLTNNNKNTGFESNAQMFLEAQNRTAKGLEYGAHVGLTLHTPNSTQPFKWFSKSFIWMEHSDMGRLEIGSNDDASFAMRMGADRIATATGGIAGEWFKLLNDGFFNAIDSTTFAEFHLAPWPVIERQLGFEDIDGGLLAETYDKERSRKITYYSPKLNGFQIGASYIFDDRNYGNTSSMPNTDGAIVLFGAGAGQYNLISGGVSWEGDIPNNISASISAVAAYGSVRKGYDSDASADVANPSEDTAAFEVSTVLSREKVKASFSYGYTGKTGFQKNPTGLGVKGSWYTTAGASYKHNKYLTSLTYFHGNKNTNTSDIISLGVDYDMASGIMPYAEITHYKLKLRREGALALERGYAAQSVAANVTAANEDNNNFSGTAFIVGTKLSF